MPLHRDQQVCVELLETQATAKSIDAVDQPLL